MTRFTVIKMPLFPLSNDDDGDDYDATVSRNMSASIIACQSKNTERGTIHGEFND